MEANTKQCVRQAGARYAISAPDKQCARQAGARQASSTSDKPASDKPVETSKPVEARGASGWQAVEVVGGGDGDRAGGADLERSVVWSDGNTDLDQ